jgi:hypothetical protein
MYAILVEFLVKVVGAQLRVMAAVDEGELQLLEDELTTYSTWIDDRLLALETASERLRAAAARERDWGAV